jgi:hypothetical protein
MSAGLWDVARRELTNGTLRGPHDRRDADRHVASQKRYQSQYADSPGSDVNAGHDVLRLAAGFVIRLGML